MLEYLTIKKFAAESGYPVSSVRKLVQEGSWWKLKIVVTDPQGRQLIHVPRFYQWVGMAGR